MNPPYPEGYDEQDCGSQAEQMTVLAGRYWYALEEIAGRGCLVKYTDSEGWVQYCEAAYSPDASNGWCERCLAARALGLDHAEVK